MSVSISPLERLLHIAVDTFKVGVLGCVPPPKHDFASRTSFANEEYELELVLNHDESAYLSVEDKKQECKLIFATDSKNDEYLLSVSVPSTKLEQLTRTERSDDHTHDDVTIAIKVKYKAKDFCEMNLYCTENITYPIDVRIPAKNINDVSAALFLRYFGPVRKKVSSVLSV